MAWVVVTGKPDEGWRFVGPFEDLNRADEFGEVYFGDDTFWSCVLEAPEKVGTEKREEKAMEDRLRRELKGGGNGGQGDASAYPDDGGGD